MKGDISKADRNVLELLAQAAYAIHLYEGLTVKRNYELIEAYGYWQSAKEDAGAQCPDYVRADQNIFELYRNRKQHVAQLEEYFTEHKAAEKRAAKRKQEGW